MKNIAVLVTAIDSDAQAEMLRGIEECGKEHGYNISVFLWFTGGTEKDKHTLGELNIVYLPDYNLFDGMIIVGNVFNTPGSRERIEQAIEDVEIPIVAIGCEVENATSINTDGYTAMKTLVEHFVEHHQFKRIHFVKGVDKNPDADMRYQAYVDVLTEHGMPVLPERITQGDFYITGGELAVREILGSGLELPEAIVCANDTMALAACDMLMQKGYRIPEDIAMSGYDYTSEGQEHVPAMTTVKSNVYALGNKACEVLMERIENPQSVEPDTLFRIPDQVVLNESCGCAKPDDRPDRHHRSYSTTEIVQRRLIQQMIILEKGIMECDGIVGWLECLQQFIAVLDPPECYWCVNDNFVDDVFGMDVLEQEDMSVEEKLAYTDEVRVLMAYKNGIFRQKPPFESKKALDVLFEETEEPKTYVFTPLHYLERNFGYLVFVDSDFVKGNPLCVTWLIKMGDSIESIRKQSLLRNAMERLDEMYIRDSLTGMLNRFGMERFYNEVKRKCMMTRCKMHLSFIDLDGLKKINDAYGHEEGDKIITAAANILQKCAGRFKIIRYGGDEFIVMGAVKSEKEVEAYWKNVESEVHIYNQNERNKATLSLSYGHMLFPVGADTHLADCIKIVDDLMYQNKTKKKK
ncbi:MAG: GGDEF domain-containing protein [Lachnospiraceae bacterium]|nr:GGDEF domain-containing protein [Lachnospiraceae bacterium]